MNKLKTLYYSIVSSALLFFPRILVKADGISFTSNGENGTASGSGVQNISELETNYIGKARTVFSISLAVAFLVLTGIGIIKAVRLGVETENPIIRRQNIVGIIFVFVAAGLCGAVSVYAGLFTSVFR